MQGVAHKLHRCKLRCRRLAVGEAAGEVILPGLRHQQQMARQLLFAHVLRLLGKALPDGGKAAVAFVKERAVDHLAQIALRQPQPLLQAQLAVAGAGFFHQKVADPDRPPAAAAHGGQPLPGKAQVRLGQLGVGPLQGKGGFAVKHVLPGQKDAKSRLKVVVLRNRVVKAEALRTAAHQPHGQAARPVGKLLAQHCCAVGLIIASCQLHSLHKGPPLFVSAPWP